MFTATARSHNLTNRLKLEAILFGVPGLLLLITAIFINVTVGNVGKIIAVPYAFGLIGLGFGIFAVMGISKAYKGWNPGDKIVEISDAGINFTGLGNIPWSVVTAATTVGTYPKNGQLSVGFGFAAWGHGKQAQIHTPIGKLGKQPLRNKLASTYFLFVVKDAPADFGTTWELGYVNPFPGDETTKIVGISMDTFLEEKEYHQFLSAVKHFASQAHIPYGGYNAASPGLATIVQLAAYKQVGIHLSPNLVQPGTLNFYKWFNSLNEEQLNDLTAHLVNTVTQPGFMDAHTAATANVNAQISQITGYEIYPDMYYSTIAGLTILDKMMIGNPKEKDLLDKVGSLVTSVTAVFVAEKYNVPLTSQDLGVLYGPFDQAGFKNVQTSAPQALTLSQTPPQAPQASSAPSLPTGLPQGGFPPRTPQTPSNGIPGIKPLPVLPPLPKRPGQ